MPPIWAFAGRHRPKGMEYATCETCNRETRDCDLATGWIARIRPFHGDLEDPLFKEARDRLPSLEQLVPGLRAEIFDGPVAQEGHLYREGKRYDVVRAEVDGPIIARVLTTFGAKLGMALYREHVGLALPLAGAVFVQPILNGGLSQQAAEETLRILPGTATLSQGKKSVSDQFAYAFNTDNRSIVMALASFQQNLHFLLIATSEPEHYAPTVEQMFVCRIAPGELLKDRGIKSFNPRPRRPTLPGLPYPQGY